MKNDSLTFVLINLVRLVFLTCKVFFFNFYIYLIVFFKSILKIKFSYFR